STQEVLSSALCRRSSANITLVSSVPRHGSADQHAVTVELAAAIESFLKQPQSRVKPHFVFQSMWETFFETLKNPAS
ncbi:hypothetical protein STEG23_011978, partial [Scotinomys teguina]